MWDENAPDPEDGCTGQTNWRTKVARVKVDGDWIIVGHNERFAALFGGGQGLVGHSVLPVASPKTSVQALVGLLGALCDAGNEPTSWLELDGSASGAAIFISGVRESANRISLFFLPHHDLVRTVRHLEDFVLGAEQWVCVTSLDGHIVYANKAFQSAWGSDLPASCGVCDLVEPGARSETMRTLASLRNGSETAQLRMKVRRRGEQRWFEWRFLTRPLEGFLWARVVDVTEQVLAERARNSQQHNALVAEFAAGAAHDFNNALAAISSFAQLIERDARAESRVRSDVREILYAANHASRIAEKLIAVGREAHYRPEKVDPNRLVEESLPLVRCRATAGIEISVDLRADRHIDVDAASFQRVLYNLAINACQAMREGGRLTISTQLRVIDAAEHLLIPAGEYVELSVEDEGPGIPPELLESIFRPYFTTKDHVRGTGLGLAVSQGLAEQMSGFLQVDSEEGVGSCFRLLVPALTSSTAAPGVDAAEGVCEI